MSPTGEQRHNTAGGTTTKC